VQYIKRTTKILKENFNGDIPRSAKELCSLPGTILCFIHCFPYLLLLDCYMFAQNLNHTCELNVCYVFMLIVTCQKQHKLEKVHVIKCVPKKCARFNLL